MATTHLTTALVFVCSLLCSFQSLAQPFTLDETIKPVELTLKEDTRSDHKGETFIATLSTVDSLKHYVVQGHDMFQFVDVIVKGFGNEYPLKASLVYDNWGDIIESQTSTAAEDGMIQFQIRAFGAFGLLIESPSEETINFTIMVRASKPQKSYLGSPFTKITESEMSLGSGESNNDSGDSGGNNTVLYIIIGVALLVIGLLAGKLMGRKSATILLLLFGLSFSTVAQGGGTPGFFYKDRFFNGEDLDDGTFERELRDEMGDGYDPSGDVEKLTDKLKSIKSFLDNAVNLYKSYTGLGSCIGATPPPGEPRIPSFCAVPTTDAGFDDESSCAGCFLAAREQFNEVRYLFEQLATIYKCTKNFSNAALSFGDNASGIHGVSGLAWQTQRRNIEKSVTDLETAYDKKYGELLESLSESMLKLSECEARYGVEDWFDRFGYMYFEFMRDKYQRKD
ncbi:hypothetical protein [Altibacter sp. HG106]|uniref:hypothetical protein n=1 Tax=Altibacter sp. HG106 TaxID=3023937 RepID=UPI002350EE76|nr:hypothetical protein [Altibacter sp. HG106]MDC7995313.1 hypothetical protein [Altibacter sp. HG106]